MYSRPVFGEERVGNSSPFELSMLLVSILMLILARRTFFVNASPFELSMLLVLLRMLMLARRTLPSF